MEDHQYGSRPLFSLSIDPVTKAQLSETARWAKFLAIVGMIGVVLIVLGGVAYSIWISVMMESLGKDLGNPSPAFETAYIFGSAIGFIIIAAVAFFPMLYMFRFANRMRKALDGNDQQSLNSSFQSLKIYFRYLGIITIISLALWIFWIVAFGLVAMTI